MKRLGWRRWLILIAFLLAASVAGLFVVRTVRRAVYWSRHRDEAIRPWMSVAYVAHSYRVPPHVLYRAVNLTPVPHDRRPLREVAREQNRPLEELTADLEKAIGEFRAHPERYPPPPPQPDGGKTR
ncbi:MAG: hypothetical protein JOZ02_20535 [Acidobacteria bacterium]|nr:hypothetical protein [Acidobacteriota bacterium]